MARDFSKNLANYASMPVGTLTGLLGGGTTAKVAISAWVQPDTIDTGGSNQNRILSGPINGASTGLLMAINAAGTIRIGARSTTADSFLTKDSTTTIAVNTLHQVGGVIDFGGNTITPYVDGAASNGGAVTTFGSGTFAPGTPTGNDMVGADVAPPSSTANQFDGRLEYLAVWVGTSGASSFASAMASLATGDTTPDQVSVSGWTLALYHPLTDSRPDRATSLATAASVLTFAGSVPSTPYTLIAPEPTDDVLFLSDSFTGTAATSINGRAADASGGNWTLASYNSGGASDLQLTGSGGLRGVYSASGTAYAYQALAMPTVVGWFEATATTLATLDGDIRFFARLATSAANGIVFRSAVASNQWQIGTVIAGTQTNLITGSMTFAGSTTYNIRGVFGHRNMALYVNKKLVCNIQLATTAFIGQYGHFGVAINHASAGAQAGTDGWRLDDVKVRRASPISTTLAVGKNGGASGDPYAGYHLPMIARTANYYIFPAEARLSPGADDSPKDLVCWRIPRSDVADGTFAGKLNGYTRIVIRGDGTSGSKLNHNPIMIVDDDGVTIRLIHFYYDSTSVINSPVAGTSGNTALVYQIVSTDEGATWGSPADITTQLKVSTEVRLTLGPGSPVRLRDGTYIMGMATGTATSGLGDRNPRLIYTRDQGRTWQRGAATSYSGEVESAAVRLWDETILLNVRHHVIGATDHLYSYFSDVSTRTSETTEDELYQASSDTDGLIHSMLRGWAANEYIAIHDNSADRERQTLRVSRTVKADAWDLPVDNGKRVLPGRLFDDGYTAYSNMFRHDDNSFLVVSGGGEGPVQGAGSSFLTWMEDLRVFKVDRTWTGLTGPSNATGFVLSCYPTTVAVGVPVQITATLSGGETISSPLVITLIDDHTSTISGTITIPADGTQSRTASITPTNSGTHAITATHTGGGFAGGNGSTSFDTTGTPTVTGGGGSYSRGAAVQLTASGFSGAVTWSSDDTSKATVNSSGLVAILGAGTANITGAYAGNSESASTTVTGLAVGISVSPGSATIAIAGTQPLTATVTNAVNTAANWSTGNAGIASVNSSGLVTGVHGGTVSITATSAADGTVTDSATITVLGPAGVGRPRGMDGGFPAMSGGF